MGAEQQIIRKGRKFDQVLDGARDIFMRDGFEGASVDDIARCAGVSKATLYSYFPDKRLLFMEVAKGECRRQADDAADLIDMTAPARQVLTIIAHRIIDFVLSDFGQKVFRICVAESDRFPGLGAEFYQSGPMVVRERVKGFLHCAADRGELVIEDYDLAADQLAMLCHVDIFDRMTFGLTDRATKAEVDRVIVGAVDMFMARYGVRG
jgi:TetR/AcrR family transcriptional regulator, mexJK operon transcriptional repressor